VKKLEGATGNEETLLTEIVVNFIEMDGSIGSSMTKKLIDGIWCDGETVEPAKWRSGNVVKTQSQEA
jgi:hypothetical protein